MIDSGSAMMAAVVTGGISLIVWTFNAVATSLRDAKARGSRLASASWKGRSRSSWAAPCAITATECYPRHT